jgi:chromosome segregation ATPase
MLKEIKKECDKNSFDVDSFSLIYPSFIHFRPIFKKYGFLSKKSGVYKVCRKINLESADLILNCYREKLEKYKEGFQQKETNKSQKSKPIKDSKSISLDALVKYSDNLKLKTKQKSEQETEQETKQETKQKMKQKAKQKAEQETEQETEQKLDSSLLVIESLRKEYDSIFEENGFLKHELKTAKVIIEKLISENNDLNEKIVYSDKILEQNIDLVEKINIKSEVIVKLEKGKEELNKIIKELRGIIEDVTESYKAETEKENLEFRACCKNNTQLKPIKKTIKIFGITVVTIKVSENV